MVAGAAALVFLAVFFALPVYAAVTACTMPCCASHAVPAGAVSPAASPCGTECVIRGDEATVVAVPVTASAKAQVHKLVASVADTIPPPALPAAADGDTGSRHGPGTDAPLHLLHSVFRI